MRSVAERPLEKPVDWQYFESQFPADQPASDNESAVDWSILEQQFDPDGQLLAILMSEMETDEVIKQMATRFIGKLAVGKSAEKLPNNSRISSLKEAIHLAAQGDPEALAFVWACAATDVIERTLKAGH